MEPFLDGGLFEVLIAVLIGYSLNFIFLKKYVDRYFKKSNLPVEPEQAVKWQSHTGIPRRN